MSGYEAFGCADNDSEEEIIGPDSDVLLHGFDVLGESDDDEFDEYAAPAVFNRDKFLLRDTGITSALRKLGDQAVTFTVICAWHCSEGHQIQWECF